MAYVLKDVVEETTTTAGTGTLTVTGATTWHQKFVSAIGSAKNKVE